MNLSERVSRRELRALWSDPARRVRTLETLADTTADGGCDLLCTVH